MHQGKTTTDSKWQKKWKGYRSDYNAVDKEICFSLQCNILRKQLEL